MQGAVRGYQDPNNLSNWYPKIKDCGIKTPETIIVTCPKDIIKSFFMDDPDKDRKIIMEWASTLMPKVKELKMGAFVFIKNGNFSNKFDASSCIVHSWSEAEIAMAIIDINYTALMFGAGGIEEIVFREFIDYNNAVVPCIYNGLPFRPEYRVFYDFDTHEVLYSVNYWDWGYCHEAMLRNATDRIVYETYYCVIDHNFQKHKKEVEALVTSRMEKVTGLNGRWSIDIMQKNTNMTKGFDPDNLWLIDMAVAERSAYWNPERCENAN